MVEEFKTEWWQPSYSLYEGTARAEILDSNPVIYQPDGSIFVEGDRAEVELFRVGYPYSPVFERLKAEKGYTLRLCCANLTVEDVRTINGRECIIVKAETKDATLKLPSTLRRACSCGITGFPKTWRGHGGRTGWFLQGEYPPPL
ncbi:MAG TPA: hypothetical protein ENH81_03405 [Thermococcus sp.]|nr:hypothetical protein [Thermococcus sp.]